MKNAAPWRWLVWGLLFGLAGAAPVSSSSPAQAQSRDERAVRAAYLYNLIRYVEWPAQGKELTVAFAGDAPTSDMIGKLLDGRTSDGFTLRVVQPASAEEMQRCSVLYVSGASETDIRKILDKVKGHSVLTVGEDDVFTRDGGMVALVNTGDHIRIEVNLEAAQSNEIRISSRVLGLATIVGPAGKGRN